MNTAEAIKARHSVRQYKDQPIPAEIIGVLQTEIDRCNREGDLHIQFVVHEPEAFSSMMAHYGKFTGVSNYIAMIGKKSDSLDEKCGYYGEQLVIKAQQLGLNTCWVALTYRKVKNAFIVREGEKLVVVIAVGYGETQGVAHKSKSASKVSDKVENPPAWYKKGIAAALLAPTAMNQQRFHFSLNGDRVTAKAGVGFCTSLDLGIVKYHFEVGAGKQNFHWE